MAAQTPGERLDIGVRGQVIEPGDEGYDAARQVYNGMIDKRPRAIVQCADVADVMATVNFARESGLLLAVRGRGLNGAGLGVCDDGLVLDLSMGGVRIRCNKAPKGRVDLKIEDFEGPVKLQAEVMWSRRQGFRKYEVGLYFPHVPPDVARQLTRVSLNHRLRRLMGL